MLALGRLRIATAALCLISTLNSLGQVQQQKSPTGSSAASGQKSPDSASAVTSGSPTKRSQSTGTASAKFPGARAATPAIPASSSTAKWRVNIDGNFSDVVNQDLKAADPECVKKPLDACAELLGADNKTVVGKVEELALAPDKISVLYSLNADGIQPAYVRLSRKKTLDYIYHFTAENPPAKQNVKRFQQAIAGDFCQKDENCNCTTSLLKPDPLSGSQCSSYPRGRSIDDWQKQGRPKILVDVIDAMGNPQPATLQSLSVDTAVVKFNAPSDFTPASLSLYTTGSAYTFAYTPAQPLQTNNLNYTAEDLNLVCDLDSQNKPDCVNTKPEHLQLKPLAVGADVSFVAMRDKLLVALVKAPMGLEPTALIVTNTSLSPPKSTIVRRTIKPGQSNNVLRVDMTTMDQITAQRNYGNRIAKRYIAISLDVKNPTAKKVQFNKSATYFDVDYVEARERPREAGDFWEAIKEVSTLGLYQPSVYKAPFVAGREDKNPARVARFGLEQNVKHSPVNYLSVLGSFDYTTAKTDDKLKAVELVGAILGNIATGGLVADASGAFRAGTSVFSGTFLPGVRSLVLDTSFLNRLRSNLVSQTLQETVQVPAHGSTSTIVLLPRMGILAFSDAKVPVMVSRVIDIHLDEEVVTQVDETPIEKGVCKPSYTKDQTREALGEPSGVTTEADNTSTFTFSKGPVASASFDAKGALQSCKPRSPSDQLNLATTMADATETLTDLGLSSTKLELTDGSTILADIPGVQAVYHFDSKGARLPDYTLLFDQIKAEAGKSKDDFEKFLQDKAKTLAADRSAKIADQAKAAATGKFTDGVRYESPDLKDGWMMVKFKSSGQEKDKAKFDGTSLVDSPITFDGAKPKSVN